MKKFKANLIAFFALFALGNIASAYSNFDQSGAFIGAEFGGSYSNTFSKSFNNGIAQKDTTHRAIFGYGLRGGYDFGGLIRVYGSFLLGEQSREDKYGVELNPSYKLILGASYTLQTERDEKIEIGIFGGYSAAELNNNNDIIDFGGFLYGVKIGTIYEFYPHNEIDLSVRYENIAIKKTQNDIKHTFTTNNIGIFIGYTYHF